MTRRFGQADVQVDVGRVLGAADRRVTDGVAGIDDARDGEFDALADPWLEPIEEILARHAKGQPAAAGAMPWTLEDFIAWNIRPASATERASGPTWSRVVLSGTTPAHGISPSVGFRPTMPQAAAGMRIEPPVSVPTEPNPMPSSTAARSRRSIRRRSRPIDRVGDRAEGGLVAGRAERELVQVGLADDDRAGFAQAADDRRVAGAIGAGTCDAAVSACPRRRRDPSR
jgi:hypothetical protein